MKKYLPTFLTKLAFICTTSIFAQVTVFSTGGSGAPFSFYTSFAAAVAAINNPAVHSGTITCEIDPGYTEVAPAGGFVITATGTSSNPITIKRGNGPGPNPLFTASPSHTPGSLIDAILKIMQGDYITIKALDFQENPSNTVMVPTTTNNMTEYGIAVVTMNAFDGCENITIEDCNITMNRLYRNSFGIYCSVLHPDNTPTSTNWFNLPANATLNNLVIRRNNIQNTRFGIVVVGIRDSNATTTLHSQNITIGGSPGNGNTIQIGHFEAPNPFPSDHTVVASLPSSTGIHLSNCVFVNVSYNNVSVIPSPAQVNDGYLYGINHETIGAAFPAFPVTNNYTHNTISLRSDGVSSSLSGIVTNTRTANTNSTVNITHNTFQGYRLTSSTPNSFSGFVTPIQMYTCPMILNVNHNVFNDFIVDTLGSVDLIETATPSCAVSSSSVWNFNNNTFTNISRTRNFGNPAYLIDVNGGNPAGATVNIEDNVFNNITSLGNHELIIISHNAGSPGCVKNILKNVITNVTKSGNSPTDLVNPIYINWFGTNDPVNVSSNEISNVTILGNMGFVGIGFGMNGGTVNGGTKTITISNNLIRNIFATSTSSNARQVRGIVPNRPNLSSGANVIYNIFKNKIVNLSLSYSAGAGGLMTGMHFNSSTSVYSGSLTYNVYNNIIGHLFAPNITSGDAIRGISIATATEFPNATFNIYHNTVYLNATCNHTANFGSSALWHQASSNSNEAALHLRNNLFINLTVPSGGGSSNVIRRSAATLNNFISSDNNLFYGGPNTLPNRAIYRENATIITSLTNYQTLVAPRDANSRTEDTSAFFISLSPNSSDYCRVANGSTTLIESAAVPIPGISDDYWGVSRPYPSPVHGGFAPDIGASETDSKVSCPMPTTQPSGLVTGPATVSTIPGSFSAASGPPTGYLVVRSIGALNAVPITGTNYSVGDAIGNGTVVQLSPSLSFIASLLDANTQYTFTVFSYNWGSCNGPTFNIVQPLVGDGITCPITPFNHTVSSITSNSATVGWSTFAGNVTQTFTLGVFTDPARTIHISGSPFTITSPATSYNVTGLNPCTTYYTRIFATNASPCTSGNLEDQFTTTSATIVTPFTETFNTSSTTANCWSQIQEVGTGTWTYAFGAGSGSITSPYEGDLNARFVSMPPVNAGSPVTKLVSPVLDLTPLGLSPVLRFWYGQEQSAGQNTLNVYYRTSAFSPWTLLASFTHNQSTWTEYITGLPTPTSTYQIAFEGVNNFGHANVVDFVRVVDGCTGVVNWDGSWSPAAPTLQDKVTLSEDYNTAVDGSFSACTLTVDSGLNLNIANGTHVEVQYGISNNGSIAISSSGQLVQRDNYGAAPNNISLQKVKTGRRHNDVTFWSSPVQSITVGTALPDSEHYFKRRYVALDGPGGGWVVANNSDNMVPGWGYMAREVRTGLGPHTATVTYNGTANNGVIAVPVTTSVTRPYNFLGNPYPSAIHCFDFYNYNHTLNPGSIDNEFFFWNTSLTLATPPPAVYFNADYAKYVVGTSRATGTGIASVNGGPIPNGSIPTGQGFRVKSNINGNFFFTNSMRYGPILDNTQFFSEMNRYWINLTNSHNHFKQNAIVYFDETTNGVDAIGDSKLTPSASGTNLYSFIGGEKYDIQYRAVFDPSDVIPLGVSTTESGVQQYTLSLARTEGVFAGSQDIFVHDKLLNVYHNLKVSPYSFTAEGEVNDRFEITYTDGSLGIDDPALASQVVITLHNQSLIAKAPQTIKSIQVFDMSGKLIASYAPNVSEFNGAFNQVQGAYIAQYTLEDGSTGSVKLIQR